MTRPLVAPKSTAAQWIGLVFGTDGVIGIRVYAGRFEECQTMLPEMAGKFGRRSACVSNLTGNPAKRCLPVGFMLRIPALAYENIPQRENVPLPQTPWAR